jgi:hypothetical protein
MLTAIRSYCTLYVCMSTPVSWNAASNALRREGTCRETPADDA